MAATYEAAPALSGPSSMDARRRTYAQRSPARRKETTTLAPTSTTTANRPVTEKPKEKKKVQEKPINLPDPPEIIVDEQGTRWARGKLLGSGGFARVYDAQNARGEMRAFKVIAKKHLQSKKARSKILAEIMIHSSLKHPNVVRMEDTFEDDEHVYFRLELCKAGSMNDMVKRRGRYLDAEARYFMVQILAGCQGMHTSNIIHRDLKLGNIFLDEDMNVKIGDFGLAALLKDQGERKKTVCGTPNYIAPEVLYDDGEGHSFEVDVWSVGVILYTMLVGKPPFQTSNIQEIYTKIKKNDYHIPAEAELLVEAEDLITKILAPKPSDRPSLIEIMNHPWFTCGAIPIYIPMQATVSEPRLTLPLTVGDNARNFALVKQRSAWNPNADDLLDEEEQEIDAREELRHQEALEAEREKMDREFQQAIQPASPISTLLKASRQPLVKAPMASASAKSSGAALARQFQTLGISRAQSGQKIATATGAVTKSGSNGSVNSGKVTPLAAFDKENAHPSPPARGMAPPSTRRAGNALGSSGLNGLTAEGGEAEERRMLGQKARLVAGNSGTSGSNVAAARSPTAPSSDEEGLPSSNFVRAPPAKASTIESMTHYLSEAIQAAAVGMDYQPLTVSGEKLYFDEPQAESPKVFVISWLDHSEKYGLGYALSDGSVGVYFRDSTSLSINCSRTHCDYIASAKRGALSRSNPAVKSTGTAAATGELSCYNFNFAGYPKSMDLKDESQVPYATELQPKVKILRFFEQEIMDRLYGANSPLTFRDMAIESGMAFVHKWYRCQQAIVFRLSTGTVQFNFYDHAKVFLSADGLIVSMIPPTETTGGQQVMCSYYLTEIIAISHPERSLQESQALAEASAAGLTLAEVGMRITTPLERRTVRNMLKRLKYCRDVLATTVSSAAVSASASSSVASAAGARSASTASAKVGTAATLAPAGSTTLPRSTSTSSAASSTASSGASRTVVNK
ncbi:Pkinase-domain-containing protein [Microstroma glucosiphilum]|uniref:Serine/threonine-protein kinase n=1 Tax=Pseudomicrostroma glucosiphilum TaxID=1684307 RepID=A0A316UDR4_9BASI|nr:Pkinase-domain-containing protein [Pseudomicrostroma glucosiphilum]PWN23349.1 Pkinase-domain-containing protein [Pseudomicrostroma glucosiphilum]